MENNTKTLKNSAMIDIFIFVLNKIGLEISVTLISGGLDGWMNEWMDE
ncbi:MAG: hypothetical protein K9I47_11010 [Bacteroidales bacterium]|nr:hypothetical protein [Bacteroidales bacterium]